ncbi:DNA polymerase III subunit gamma and tau [Polymorphospora sp. A560]
MALALYRKYRPRTFAEVIGQEHVTEPLSQALRSGRLNHAYLFSGPRGCGKTSSARILARSLNCEHGPTPEPCGTCGSCRSLANDGAGSIDVMEIDAASHGGVDDARELRERAFFAPANSRFKIYVIDEAHMVSSAGFNALLKLVEEPPDYVKFIFATTEPEKVLGTIKSRTHHYPFRLIPPAVLRPYLEQLTEAEGIKVDPAVFPLVVRAGGGSARDSLSVLDQLIAGAGPEGVSYARAVALLGVTDSALIDEMCDALAAGDGAAAYATIDRVAEAGHDPRRFASDLLERLRDLIVLRQVPDAAAKGLVDGPADQVERMAAQAERLGSATLSRCADIVHNGLVEMRGTTAPRLLLELIAARMLLPGADDGSAALLQRVERMERRLTVAGGGELPPVQAVEPVRPAAAPRAEPQPQPQQPPTPQQPPAPQAPQQAASARTESRPAQPAAAPRSGPPAAAVMPDPVTPDPPAPGTPVAPGALDAAAVRRSWDQILSTVAARSKRAAAVVREATVSEVDGNTLVLSFRHSVHATMLTNSPDLLVEAIGQVLGGRWQIRCEVGGDGGRPAPTPQPRPTPPPPPPPPSAPPAAPPRPAAGSPPAGGSTGSDWPEPARPPSAGPAQAGRGSGGSDWPEPARPPSAVSTAAGSDWPEAARPGGRPAAPAPAPSGETDARPSGTGTPPATSPPAVNGGGAGAGLAAARAAAAAANRGTAGRDGVPAAQTAAPAAVAAPPVTPAPAAQAPAARAGAVQTADPSWAGEPPYDPDYDGPVRGGVTYEGFDPGDEPLDDVVDVAAVRQSSEQQVVQLLHQTLGAERLDG